MQVTGRPPWTTVRESPGAGTNAFAFFELGNESGGRTRHSYGRFHSTIRDKASASSMTKTADCGLRKHCGPRTADYYGEASSELQSAVRGFNPQSAVRSSSAVRGPRFSVTQRVPARGIFCR